jgi:hypothetical protein
MYKALLHELLEELKLLLKASKGRKPQMSSSKTQGAMTQV